MALGVGWALYQQEQLQLEDDEVAVTFYVKTTADHEKYADIEYSENPAHRQTVEDAKLQWRHHFAAKKNTLVWVEGTKGASLDPNAVFSCEIHVNGQLVYVTEAEDNNEFSEDPPQVACEWVAR